MPKYTVVIEAGSDDRQVWQALHPAEEIEVAGAAEEVAENVAYDQNLAKGWGWRVRVWDGWDVDQGATEPAAAVCAEEFTPITAEEIRSLRSADYGPIGAVLVVGNFDHGPFDVMPDVTARDHGYEVLATAVELYEAWGDEPMNDAELEQVAADFQRRAMRPLPIADS